MAGRRWTPVDARLGARKGKSVEVYLSDAAGKPVDASATRGSPFHGRRKPRALCCPPAGGDRLIGTRPPH